MENVSLCRVQSVEHLVTPSAPPHAPPDAGPGVVVSPKPLNAESARAAKDRSAKAQLMRFQDMPANVLQSIWGALRKDSNPWESAKDSNMLASTCKSLRDVASQLKKPQLGKPVPSLALLNLRCQAASELIGGLNFSRDSLRTLEESQPLFGFISPAARQRLFQVPGQFHFQASLPDRQSVEAVVEIFRYLATHQRTAFFEAVMRFGTKDVLAAMGPAVVYLTPEQAVQWEEKYAASAEPSDMVGSLPYVSSALAVQVAEAVLTLSDSSKQAVALSKMPTDVRCLPSELGARIVEACLGIVEPFARARAVAAMGAAVPDLEDEALGIRVVKTALGDFECQIQRSVVLSGMGAAVTARFVPTKLRTQVIEASLELEEGINQAYALSGMGVALPFAPEELGVRVFEAALALESEYSKVIALSGLGVAVPNVPALLGIRAARTILAMKDDWNKAIALSGFLSAAANLPEEMRSDLHNAALNLTGQARSRALSGLALAQETPSPMVEAQRVLLEVQDTEAQSKHLLALRTVVQKYGSQADCDRVDQAVQTSGTQVAYLSAQELAQRIQVALALPNEIERGDALSELVTDANLPAQEYSRVVQAILGLPIRALTRALRKLVKTAEKMTISERSQMLQIVLGIGIGMGMERATMLCTLQPAIGYFTEAQVIQMIDVAAALPNEQLRAGALQAIGTAMGRSRVLLKKIVKAAQDLRSPLSQAMVLSAVSDAAIAENILSPKELTCAVQGALNEPEPIGSMSSKLIISGKLSDAVKHVPDTVRSQIADAITNPEPGNSEHDQITARNALAPALIALAPALAHFNYSDCVRIFRAGQGVRDQVLRTQVISALVSHR
jgi:hypothetical protein